MELSQDDIAEIERRLAASPYAELTIETARRRITLRRTASGAWTEETQTLSRPEVLSRGRTEAASEAKRTQAAASEDGLVDIFPPLPGTFYRAPKPGAEPFVEVGAPVTADMVVGIIETMKLMNPARAGIAGTIAQICARNGELVDTGDVLMRVRPRAGAGP